MAIAQSGECLGASIVQIVLVIGLDRTSRETAQLVLAERAAVWPERLTLRKWIRKIGAMNHAVVVTGKHDVRATSVGSMTRIISGFAGSIVLKTPGVGTRPTSDRVREAVFSALESRGLVEGARVLDLFAGSGALGLEAASRGAAVVRLVERNGPGAASCRINAAAVLRQAPSRSRLTIDVSPRLVQSFLTTNPETWDLVFMDPPYDLDEAELAENLRAVEPRLAPDATLCLERSSRSPEPRWPVGIERARRTDYGDTTLWWANPTVDV